MNIFEFINQVILFLLAISTLVGILDFIGFLPKKIRNWLKLNRMDGTLELLKELGIDIDQHRRSNIALKYPKKFTDENIEEVTNNALKKYKITKKVSVGHHRPTELDYYYDLIGATCNEKVAQYFAHILSTYWSSHLTGKNKIENYYFDFIVTPKAGSPLLGYEFSKLVDKPFVLHEDTERFGLEDDMRVVFDCYQIPDKGTTALIVDDSTTGGSMVCRTIDDLRKYGYQVYTCFVVFEPKSKNARERILDQNVELVSVVQTHDDYD